MQAKIRNSSVYRKNARIQNGQNGVQNGLSLDTLAQLVTNPVNRGFTGGVDDDFKVSGGTSTLDLKSLQKRARRKTFTAHLVPGLVTAADNSGSCLQKGYWRSYHCCSVLTVDADGRAHGKYCKQRWCMVCNSIRTAQNIIRYGPIVNSWGSDVYFVTLTEKNCKGECLRQRIDRMQKTFTKVKNSLRMQIRRSSVDADPFVGIRKLECTHNEKTNEYNPHYHLVIRGREYAEYVLNEWVKRNVYAKRPGQDIRPADGNTLVELFKYMTKVVTRVDGRSRQINHRALDVIFLALRRKRTIQPFGFKVSAIEEEEAVVDAEMFSRVYAWIHEMYDWVEVSTGDMLSGYVPSPEFIKFLDGYK